MLLTRYAGSLIIRLSLIFLLAAASFMWLIILFAQFGDIGKGGFGFWQSVQYALLRLTDDLRILFPIACLLGTTVAFSLLASRSELTIMRLAGYSFAKLFQIVGGSVLLLLVPFILFLELVAPKLNAFAVNKKHELITGYAQEWKRHNIWLKQNDEFFYVHEVTPQRELRNIIRFRFTPHMELLEHTQANTAREGRHGWRIQGITTTDFTSFPLRISQAAEETWNFAMPIEAIQQQADLELVTFPELFHLWYYAWKNQVSEPLIALTFWQRLVYPIAVFFIVTLALPLLAVQGRNIAFGLRILLAVILGVIFYLATNLLGYLGLAYAWPPWLAAGFLPTIMGVGLIFLYCKNTY